MTHLIIRTHFFGEKFLFRTVNFISKEKKVTNRLEKKRTATIIISTNDNFIKFYKENTTADKKMVIAQPIRSR